MVTTTDKLVMEVDVKKSMVDLDKLHKKIESITGGVARLVASKEIPTKGIVRYRYEIEKTTRSMKELSKVSDKVQNSYRKNVTRVTTQFKRGKPAPIPVPPQVQQPIQKTGITGSMMGQGKPSIPFSMPPYINPNTIFPSKQTSPFDNIGTAGFELFPASEKIATENLRINKMLSSINRPYAKGGAVSDTRASFAAAGIDTIGYGDKRFIPKPQKQAETCLDKFSKGLRNATKQVFMMQMGMLGVSFSSQALVSSLQGLGMSALTGLADTETAIKNMVISDVFGGTDILNDINLDEFVDNSLKAQGAVAGLSTILVQIANKVFSDPATADKIANALTQVVNKLTEPEFIDAVLGIVDAITNPDFVKSMMDAALQIANLIKQLGEQGLLDEVILLIIACQFLMPLFAILQLALIGLGALLAAEVFAAIVIVIAVLWAFTSSLSEFGKSGNIALDVFNVIYSTFVKLFELLLYIPAVIFDVISGAISELTGGLINIMNPFKEFTNGLWGLKDILNTTFGSPTSGYAYDTGTHQYVNIINYNKNITGKDAVYDIQNAFRNGKNSAIT